MKTSKPRRIRGYAVLFNRYIPLVGERIGAGTEVIFKIYPTKAAAQREAMNWDDYGELSEVLITLPPSLPKKSPQKNKLHFSKTHG